MTATPADRNKLRFVGTRVRVGPVHSEAFKRPCGCTVTPPNYYAGLTGRVMYIPETVRHVEGIVYVLFDRPFAMDPAPLCPHEQQGGPVEVPFGAFAAPDLEVLT